MAGEGLGGADKMAKRLLALKARIPGDLAIALYQETLVVEKDSRLRTPVKVGTLRGSHVTARPVQIQGVWSCKISVGGPAAPYAVYVHYNLEAEHLNGEALFLQHAIEAAQHHMKERIADRLRQLRALEAGA